jgi:twitching motility two-component system response regulator PilG
MSKKEILIVEDEKSLLELLCLLLTTRGYKVQGVINGQMALDCVADRKPDLMLLDVMLPGVDGFEVCRQIKSGESTKNIHVIMVTSKTSREDVLRAEQAGADGFITKPFKSAMLVETVKRFLSGDFPQGGLLTSAGVS